MAIVALAVASVLGALSEAGILTVAAQVAAALVDGQSRIHTNVGGIDVNTTVSSLLLVGLGFSVLRLILQFPIAWIPSTVASDVQAGMRNDLFRAYTASSWDVQAQDQEGHFQELMTNQINVASQGALQATTMLALLFTFLVLAASAFALNVLAALVVLVAALGLFAAMRPLNALGHRLARRLSSAQLSYAGAVGEANSVAEETQVFGVAAAQRERILEYINAAKVLFAQTQMTLRLSSGIYQSVIYMILVLGLMAINASHVSHFSSLGAVVLLLIRAGTYGQQVQGCYQYVRQSIPYIERVQEATHRYEDAEARTGKIRIESVRTIAFDEVSYAYPTGRPGRAALSRVSFEINGGETIGVIGPSGAGKSTLVQILLRLRTPTSGTYLLNGVSAQEYLREDWNRRVAYVPQQPRLVYASVAENVRLFRSLDDAAVERACRLARIHDDIMSWSDGYDTIVGPRAEAVSGGQQQRICLARSLAAGPDVLVLDEPTSALDPRSEALIQESLTAIKESLTLFIIAHRMSTLSICDRVIVVLDGQINAFDTLDALKQSNDYYRLASSLSGVAEQSAVSVQGALAGISSERR